MPEAVRTGAPAWSADVTQIRSSAMFGRRVPAPALLAVPLVSRSAMRGVLFFASRAGRVFTDAERALATALAGELAVGLENAELYAAAQDQVRHLSLLARDGPDADQLARPGAGPAGRRRRPPAGSSTPTASFIVLYDSADNSLRLAAASGERVEELLGSYRPTLEQQRPHRPRAARAPDPRLRGSRRRARREPASPRVRLPLGAGGPAPHPRRAAGRALPRLEPEPPLHRGRAGADLGGRPPAGGGPRERAALRRGARPSLRAVHRHRRGPGGVLHARPGGGAHRRGRAPQGDPAGHRLHHPARGPGAAGAQAGRPPRPAHRPGGASAGAPLAGGGRAGGPRAGHRAAPGRGRRPAAAGGPAPRARPPGRRGADRGRGHRARLHAGGALPRHGHRQPAGGGGGQRPPLPGDAAPRRGAGAPPRGGPVAGGDARHRGGAPGRRPQPGPHRRRPASRCWRWPRRTAPRSSSGPCGVGRGR